MSESSKKSSAVLKCLKAGIPVATLVGAGVAIGFIAASYNSGGMPPNMEEPPVIKAEAPPESKAQAPDGDGKRVEAEPTAGIPPDELRHPFRE